MAQYIPKDALVAEIERIKKELLQRKWQCERKGLEKIMHQISILNKMLSFLNTLEVKEADLDKEIENYFKGFGKFASVGIDDCIDIAKHFFELGMQASNKVQKGE